MKRTFFASLIALVCVATMLGQASSAQTRRGSGGAANTKPQATTQRPQATAQTQRTVPLPASDAVLTVNMRRLLTEALPRAFASDAAKLAEINADIEQFKRQTGIEARSIDTLAVGARFTNPSPDVTKIDHVVVIARGAFNSGTIVAAGRLASQGKYSEQQHNGKAVHVFNVIGEAKLFGLFKIRLREVALSVLDANTLAIGEPEAVRAAIDAAGGSGRIDAGLLDLAGTASDVIGYAGNVPASATRDLDFGMPEITRSISSIRRFYGGIGMAGTGFQMLTVLRTTGPQDARSLGDTIEAVKQIAPGLISMSGSRGKLARGAIESLKVTSQGSEVQLRIELSPSDIAGN
ncbi:MAG TPA: hypothetical protein VM934_05725 [Pyrinomonadaceae bacterium]|jgi:hypothetical protein|nr:hypothetical protein [Pyrinomonadaceae bacterium]